MIRFFILILCCFGSMNSGIAQFAPAAGQPGTTAVHKDSVAIIRWANAVVSFKRGASDIANGWGTLTSFGDSTQALGYAQGNSTSVVSLGDSGYVTLGFPFPIMNGPGNDFAVFENSFDDSYLELAFVEVSSDGVYFVRFPAVSLTQVVTQTGSFGYTDPEQVHNLAGKYRQGYGTPFDLEDIVGSGGIDLDSIRFVRVVDVIGTINGAYSTFDSQGNRVNDPYPTDFAAGGFDLDAVGVINENNIYASAEKNERKEDLFSIYPNPSDGIFFIQTAAEVFDLKILDLTGKLVFADAAAQSGTFDFSGLLEEGVYLVYVNGEGKKMMVF